jgi:hypothetical protein
MAFILKPGDLIGKRNIVGPIYMVMGKKEEWYHLEAVTHYECLIMEEIIIGDQVALKEHNMRYPEFLELHEGYLQRSYIRFKYDIITKPYLMNEYVKNSPLYHRIKWLMFKNFAFNMWGMEIHTPPIQKEFVYDVLNFRHVSSYVDGKDLCYAFRVDRDRVKTKPKKVRIVSPQQKIKTR